VNTKHHKFDPSSNYYCKQEQKYCLAKHQKSMTSIERQNFHACKFNKNGFVVQSSPITGCIMHYTPPSVHPSVLCPPSSRTENHTMFKLRGDDTYVSNSLTGRAIWQRATYRVDMTVISW